MDGQVGLMAVERFVVDCRGGAVGFEFGLGAGRRGRGGEDGRPGEIEPGEILDRRLRRKRNGGGSRSFFRWLSPLFSPRCSKGNPCAGGAQLTFHLRVRNVRVGKAFAELADHRPSRSLIV